jgi:hypothetical protein
MKQKKKWLLLAPPLGSWKHTFTRKPFCQTVYRNRFSSTDRAVREAEAKKKCFTGKVKSCQTGSWFEALIEFAICKLCRRVYAKRTCALVTCDFHLVTTSTSTISFRFWPLHRSKRWMDAWANRAILVILLITGIWNGSRKKVGPVYNNSIRSIACRRPHLPHL